MYHRFEPEVASKATIAWIEKTLSEIASQKASFEEARNLTLLVIELSLDNCPEDMACVDASEAMKIHTQITTAYSLAGTVSTAIADQFPTLHSTLKRFQQTLLAVDTNSINMIASFREESEEEGKTYIVKNPITGHIKIGKSTSPDRRIKTISSSSGVKLEVIALVDGDIEHQLHERFSEYRTYGEWFEDRDEKITNYAKQLSL